VYGKLEISNLKAMFSPQDHKWMAQALTLAEAAFANGEVPIGAVIVLNEKQIGAGQNRMEEMQSATAHAEILAINEASEQLKNWRLDGATIYVSLEPCQMCLGAIKNSRISRVVFAACDTSSYNHLIKSENGLLEEKSVEILQKFFRNVRRNKGDSGLKAMPSILPQ
jgi:tRNA(adenine34) deaminase